MTLSSSVTGILGRPVVITDFDNVSYMYVAFEERFASQSLIAVTFASLEIWIDYERLGILQS
jgi:hypothetical protein